MGSKGSFKNFAAKPYVIQPCAALEKGQKCSKSVAETVSSVFGDMKTSHGRSRDRSGAIYNPPNFNLPHGFRPNLAWWRPSLF